MRSFPSSRFSAGAMLALAFVVPTMAQNAPPTSVAGSLEAYEQFGSTAAKSAGITDLNWSEAQFAAFVAGLRAAQDKRPVAMGEPGRQLLAETQRRLAEVRAQEKAAQDPDLAEFMATAKKGLDLQQTDSGLLYRVLKPGSGPRPRPGDMIVANFIANKPDGRTGIPALSGRSMRVRVGTMPPGVNEGLQMVTLGGHALLVIPPHLSFGAGKWPEGIEPGSPILLQVELVDILPAGAAP